MFIAALYIIAKKWEQPKYPSDDKSVNKMCLFMQLVSHKKE